MKSILITGSTGMIGNLILQNCLFRKDIEKVVILVRKSIGFNHPKVIEIVHQDFLNFDSIENSLKDIDICFYCVGVYTGQVDSNTFKEITVDYTAAFASALKKNSPASTFCFLSGQGADSQEKSSILFAREKGKAENNLLRLQFPKIHIFRPGYIYPSTPRKEPNFVYRLMRVCYKPVSFFYPNIGVTSEKLAAKMIAVAFGDDTQVIFENQDIRD